MGKMRFGERTPAATGNEEELGDRGEHRVGIIDRVVRYPVDPSRAARIEHCNTSMVALNLFQETSGDEGGVANWSGISALRGSNDGPRPEHAGLDMVLPEATLGIDGVVDARHAFDRVGHPILITPIAGTA